MDIRAELLSEIDAFRAGLPPHVRMAETTFGRLAVDDGKFVQRLRDGKGVTLATIERVRAFIKNYRQQPAPPANDTTTPEAA